MSPKLDPQQVLDAMMHDKKVQHGRLHFVLPSRLGHVELVGDIDPADVQAGLQTSETNCEDSENEERQSRSMLIRIRHLYASSASLRSSSRCMSLTPGRAGRHAAAVVDFRRGAEDSQGAAGAVRLGPGGAGGGAQRTARGARRRPEARAQDRRRRPRDRRRGRNRPVPAARHRHSDREPTPPIRGRCARFTIRRACCSCAAS